MAFQVPRRNKKRLSQEQVRVLETSFDHDMKLEPSRKIELARNLGLHPRQVAVWYQNKRARWKTKSLEHDYKALRLRLESFLKEKIQLEKEVESLRREVEKAKELLRLKSLPFSNDQWNSALLTDVNSCWGGADLRVDELYGCLAGRQQMDQEIEWL